MIDALLERLHRPVRGTARVRRFAPGAKRPARPRRVPGPRRMPRPRRRHVLVLIAVLALAAGGWMWLRGSSLVAVQKVSVVGASGADAGKIRAALVVAARSMTTLDVHMDQLRSAVAPFPVVKALRVSTQFPHGIRIRVIEQVPVAAVVVAGRTIAVAGDGTLLHDVIASPSLPTIPLTVPPGGTRLSDPHALAAVEVLAAAPDQLLAHVSGVQTTAAHGLVASLRAGPSLYFGDTTRLQAKWAAVAAVLADQGSSNAVYIDVTDPERAAAGAAAPTAPATASTGSGTGAAGASPSAATGASGTAATGTAGAAPARPPRPPAEGKPRVEPYPEF